MHDTQCVPNLGTKLLQNEFFVASFFLCGIYVSSVLIPVVFLWLLTEESVCCISVSGLSSLFYDIFVFV